MGYFGSKFVCYISKGREMKDPPEKSKDIFPMTMDISNINIAKHIVYCRGVRNLL